MSRPSAVHIDLNALRHNYALACEAAPDSQNMAVVKADGYGHGATPIARALEPAVPAFGVACLEEAMALRRAGIQKPILLLEGFFNADELDIVAANNIWLLVENQWQIDTLARSTHTTPISVWLKVDTGMHRLGVQLNKVESSYQKLQQAEGVANEIVVATHFACADLLHNQTTTLQIERLKTAISSLTTSSTSNDIPLSMANSPALFAWPQARAQWNRAGYMLYGNSPFDRPHPINEKLIPVMSLTSKVISLRTVPAGESVGYGATWTATRESVIATVPVGYGDGYPRTAHSGTPVLINGQRARLAGRVSMDLITVDVTDLKGVDQGSAVELWGKALSVEEVASHAQTIGYELLTRMPGRLPRIYIGE